MFDPLRHKAKVATSTALTFLLGIGVATGLGWTAPGLSMPEIGEEPVVAEEDVRSIVDLSDAFVSLADAVTPAVVRIEVQRRREAVARQRLPIPDEFRRFFPDQPEGEDGRPEYVPSGGSGFIISEDGYILTNDHVVSGAEEITVYLQDRRYFNAEVVGTDPSTDVAVIKIDQTDLPTLPFGDSDAVRVGEWVLAVGNPGFGPSSQLDYTVTSGIVSARGRGLQLIQRELMRNPQFEDLAGYAIEDYIQTDAVINPGNSGGPMVSLRGQVIGINSAIASRTGVWQGYGFAIPINLARRVMQDLIEYGHVRRPRLGVRIGEVSPEAADYHGLPSVAGVLVQEAEVGTPAAEAGLRQGDVIVALDGEPVERVSQLQYRVAQHRPGDVVEVRYYRNGEPHTTDVRLGEAPINEVEERAPQPEATAEGRLGISIQELTPELNRNLGYENLEGVVITDVNPLGPAARRGVRPGARILEINGEEIEDQEDVKEILDDVDGGSVVAILLGDPTGNTQIVHLRVGR